MTQELAEIIISHVVQNRLAPTRHDLTESLRHHIPSAAALDQALALLVEQDRLRPFVVDFADPEARFATPCQFGTNYTSFAEQVELSKMWIRTFGTHRKTANKAPGTWASRLKHHVECWRAKETGTRPYVSEKAFIVAAAELGYRSQTRRHFFGPSIHFTMSFPKSFETETGRQYGPAYTF